MVETTLAEAMAYARTAHLSSAGEEGRAPVLYMNGWDVFEALPELWHPQMDRLPGSIAPRTVDEYERLHTAYKLDTKEALVAKARGLCKLFVGPVGAITRIHQDNHDAHAWLCNLRGKKLYVLCRPRDAPLVAPRTSLDKGLGTRYTGRLDPLDEAQRAEAVAKGLELYATVLEPGQTILAPAGWWHYAVSLTPTITLMCNFWDDTNLHGLHEAFFLQVARAMDAAVRQARDAAAHGAAHGAARGAAAAPTTRADPRLPVESLHPPVRYVASHRPFVFVREFPATDAPMLGIVLHARPFVAGAVQGGWVRSAEPFDKGRYGWVLIDGAPIKLGQLMRRADQ